ncbi:portal vertex of the head [Agrobacterium phage Atu_ph04]|uniref:Portal protein n=1 Tax=Agrobacterium phage Atu_ph04 TaxID=2024263 RepID=A0A223VZN6_9CAUD|nr:portal protein [Agrobacterium phage Atu_ph04]ASV44632.1 portal vertex of the head [Agrobacterium phage Atu_ph04]
MEFFGFTLGRSKKELPQLDVEQNGSAIVSKALSNVIDFDFTARSEVDLINAYRRISHMTEVSTAIDEIVNEIVVVDDVNEVCTIDTNRLEENGIVSRKICELIEEEFKTVIKLLKFNATAYNKVREWYVDGKIVFQKVVDPKHPNRGVQKVVQLDPRKIRKITVVSETSDGMLVEEEEFFVYVANQTDTNEKLGSSFSVQMSSAEYSDFYRKNIVYKISKDALTYVDSGLVDKSSGISYGYLHKAVKIANQLDLLKTSLIIYRLARSSERRVIYVDPGNLPPTKAQERLESVKTEFRNKTYYDTVHGTVEDKARVMSLQEDYFMLRNGSKSTEIDTLKSGENLGTIDDVLFFKEELYMGLNVPTSRFKDNSSPFNTSGNTISREEMKFHRFTTRCRSQFSELFSDILMTQLVLKRIIRPSEWEQIAENITYKFNKDNFFSEIKALEELERRLATLDQAKPWIGVYLSNDDVRREILGHTAERIADIDAKIDEERKSGRYRNRDIELPDKTIDIEVDEPREEISQ